MVIVLCPASLWSHPVLHGTNVIGASLWESFNGGKLVKATSNIADTASVPRGMLVNFCRPARMQLHDRAIGVSRRLTYILMYSVDDDHLNSVLTQLAQLLAVCSTR